MFFSPRRFFLVQAKFQICAVQRNTKKLNVYDIWVKLSQRAGTLRRRVQTPPGFQVEKNVVSHTLGLRAHSQRTRRSRGLCVGSTSRNLYLWPPVYLSRPSIGILTSLHTQGYDHDSLRSTDDEADSQGHKIRSSLPPTGPKFHFFSKQTGGES